MLKISASYFKSAVCLFPRIVSWLLGVGLRISWMRSAAVCVVASSEDILANGRVSGENSVVL